MLPALHDSLSTDFTFIGSNSNGPLRHQFLLCIFQLILFTTHALLQNPFRSTRQEVDRFGLLSPLSLNGHCHKTHSPFGLMHLWHRVTKWWLEVLCEGCPADELLVYTLNANFVIHLQNKSRQCMHSCSPYLHCFLLSMSMEWSYGYWMWFCVVKLHLRAFFSIVKTLCLLDTLEYVVCSSREEL